MVVTVLNASESEAAAQVLLSEHLHAFSDVDVIAGQKHYPAHRAVLAVHSLDFRDAFSRPLNHDEKSQRAVQVHPHPHALPDVASLPPAAKSPPAPPKSLTRYRVHIAVEDADDTTLRSGWQLVYSYIYGATVPLDTETVLAALPICRRYRFDQLAAVLDAFLCEGAVSPLNCTRVYAAATVKAPATISTRRRRDADAELVQSAAWRMMKTSFENVRDWGCLPYAPLVRLLKLNDLNVSSEATVFDALIQWIDTNSCMIDEDVVASLVKLVRFPTMRQEELERVAASTLVSRYPVCRKYISRGLAARADEKRGLVRSVVMESSPVYRRRRTDALTFSDRIPAWRSRADKNVVTSSRYFAGCLWNLIIEPGSEWVGMHLGCVSENEERLVDVELDFSVFVVRHTGAEPQLVCKEVKGACFGRSGQRIGFSHMIRRSEVEESGVRFLLRDTLFVGASIRLRCSKLDVVGISSDGDDTMQSESTIG